MPMVTALLLILLRLNMDSENNVIAPGARALKLGAILSGDTESLRYSASNGEILKFFNIDFYDGEKHYYFEDMNFANAFLDYYSRIHGVITVVFHNLSHDLQVMGLIKNVLSKYYNGLELKKAYLSGIYFLKFSDKGRHRTIQFLDSFNFFKFAVSDMAQALGKKKQSEDYDLPPEQWNKKLIAGMGHDRVQIDTEILYEYFVRFAGMKNLTLGLSMPGTAFATFRKSYLKRTISFPKSHIEAALASYRGGRCEPYVITSSPVYLKSYDHNSLYPKALRDFQYSYKFHREIDKINFDAIENGNYNYLFNVDYNFVNNDLPARLPVMVKTQSGMLTQSYAAKNVWLTGAEVLAMYKEYDNIIIRFNKGYEYFSDYLFTDFVNDFYALRLASNKIDGKAYKLMLNSLYGKFGQHKKQTNIIGIGDLKPEIYAIIMLNENSDKNIIEINDEAYNVHGDYVTVSVSMEHDARYSPLIASECTANARLINYYTQKEIGFSHVFYTDTDSYAIDRDWTESTELGKLKLEKKGMFTIYDAKDYEYTDNGITYSTTKGIRKRGKKWTKPDIEKYNLAHDTEYEVIYSQAQFSTLKTTGTREPGIVTVTDTIKKLNRRHNKLAYRVSGNGDLIGYPYDNLDSIDNIIKKYKNKLYLKNY